MSVRGRIELDNVSKVFARSDMDTTITALDEVSLTIEPGEFVSIVGASGCGKSTMLRMITGLEIPTHGELRFDGVPITGPSAKRGLVFQDPSLFPWLTVEKNIAFGLRSQGVARQEQAALVDEFTSLIGLSDFKKSYPHQLSGGMAQRVSLARALVGKPDALMLDEPLGALDAFTRMNMQDEIVRLWQQRGNTAVLITHDVDEAVYLSNRIIIMSPRPGRIRKEIKIELAYPRNRSHPDFINHRSAILEMLNFAHQVETDYYL